MIDLQKRISENDANVCGKLPVNQINLIQPYAFFLVAQISDYKIIQASVNCSDIFGQDLHGLSIEEVFTSSMEGEIENLKNQKQSWTALFDIGIKKNPDSKFCCLIHLTEQFVFLELEPQEAVTAGKDLMNLDGVMKAISPGNDLSSLFSELISHLKNVSGFDRVLLYKFDEAWNGEVVAETTEPGMDKYFGLRFPASDVPQQVRQLYFNNPYRYIPDTEYAPVKINPVINPVSNSFLDLSFCTARAVPAVHLEYLHNMKVQSSMSIPVIEGDSLWGLITCHHREAKHISLQHRIFFYMVSQLISSRVSAIENQEKLSEQIWVSDTKLTYSELFSSSLKLREIIFSEEADLMQIFNVSGFAVNLNGLLEHKGKIPDKKYLHTIFDWLRIHEKKEVFYTESFAEHNDDALMYSDVASGLISIPVNADKGFFIVGFREEIEKTVNWSGNPEKAVTISSDGKNYHPRNSFSIWQQQVKNKSAQWTDAEIEVAEYLFSQIQKRKI